VGAVGFEQLPVVPLGARALSRSRRLGFNGSQRFRHASVLNGTRRLPWGRSVMRENRQSAQYPRRPVNSTAGVARTAAAQRFSRRLETLLPLRPGTTIALAGFARSIPRWRWRLFRSTIW